MQLFLEFRLREIHFVSPESCIAEIKITVTVIYLFIYVFIYNTSCSVISLYFWPLHVEPHFVIPTNIWQT